ncbi:MAG: hypothetical protein R3C25_05180 [Hyphomonadaceae bacterium]
MKHAKPTRAWRPVRAYRTKPTPEGVLNAFVFNLCLFLLPIAAAAAVLVIGRDHLYAYEYSEGGARSISTRVERLNGELIQVDFDRLRQWDNLVAMELMENDASAARGFLLSGEEMLPARMANILRRAAADGAGDAAIEVAALQLLTPGTRQRYQAIVPLLSLRPARARPAPGPEETLADSRDFELMARALLSEPETDPLQFVLTGFSLGLAGEMSPSMNAGAVALLAASRRDDFPHALAADIEGLAAQAAPIETFRAAASQVTRGDAGAYENAAQAFRTSVDEQQGARLRGLLAAIGDIALATSPESAATMLTHASGQSDIARLRLLALTAGDRAAAAAKRLPRDGRLVATARGELAMNRDLILALAAAGLSLLGLVAAIALKLYQLTRNTLASVEDADDDYESELLDISVNNWRPL